MSSFGCHIGEVINCLDYVTKLSWATRTPWTFRFIPPPDTGPKIRHRWQAFPTSNPDFNTLPARKLRIWNEECRSPPKATAVFMLTSPGRSRVWLRPIGGCDYATEGIMTSIWNFLLHVNRFLLRSAALVIMYRGDTTDRISCLWVIK